MGKLLAFVLALLLTQSAAAMPRRRWDSETLHTLARTLVGEADWHRADYAPIAYVLERRWRMRSTRWSSESFSDYIRLYSAVWKKHEYRPSTIRLLPWAAHAGPWGGAKWDWVRSWVRRWAAGDIRDPCPRAMHWGGTMDSPQAHWKPVSCGKTKNIFWRVTRG